MYYTHTHSIWMKHKIAFDEWQLDGQRQYNCCLKPCFWQKGWGHFDKLSGHSKLFRVKFIWGGKVVIFSDWSSTRWRLTIARKYQFEPWVTGQLSTLNIEFQSPDWHACRDLFVQSLLMRANAHGWGWKQHGVIVLLLFVWGSPDASWIEVFFSGTPLQQLHSLWLSLWRKIFDLEVGNESELMSLGAHCDNWTRRWNVGLGSIGEESEIGLQNRSSITQIRNDLKD